MEESLFHVGNFHSLLVSVTLTYFECVYIISFIDFIFFYSIDEFMCKNVGEHFLDRSFWLSHVAMGEYCSHLVTNYLYIYIYSRNNVWGKEKKKLEKEKKNL